jgi:adenine deaminase
MRDESVLDKLRAFGDRRIDGHAPGVHGAISKGMLPRDWERSRV